MEVHATVVLDIVSGLAKCVPFDQVAVGRVLSAIRQFESLFDVVGEGVVADDVFMGGLNLEAGMHGAAEVVVFEEIVVAAAVDMYGVAAAVIVVFRAAPFFNGGIQNPVEAGIAHQDALPIAGAVGRGESEVHVLKRDAGRTGHVGPPVVDVADGESVDDDVAAIGQVDPVGESRDVGGRTAGVVAADDGRFPGIVAEGDGIARGAVSGRGEGLLINAAADVDGIAGLRRAGGLGDGAPGLGQAAGVGVVSGCGHVVGRAAARSRNGNIDARGCGGCAGVVVGAGGERVITDGDAGPGVGIGAGGV